MNNNSKKAFKIFRTEDYWAIWLGMVVIFLCIGFYWADSSLTAWAVTPGTWSNFGQLSADLGKHIAGYIVVYIGFGLFFTLSMKLMGRNIREFVVGYTVLFIGSLAVFYLAGWSVMKKLDLGAPLLALLIGLVISNIKAPPQWLYTSLRTEYYIKTGIVLLGATLPLTLIVEAGPIAFIQATIVSVTTWLTIFLAATKIFKLEPRFGAVLGTGGAVCGVSGSIAVGGAVRAEKDHIAVGIAVVSIWAIVMIFVLAILTKWMIPADGKTMTEWYHISPGESGAWVGTSEYADAAGFAVVAELANEYGDAPIHAFTLMKVIGRDIWIGIWAFVLSIVSVVYWESKNKNLDGPQGRVGLSVVWERFPKFVLGFFAASIIMSLIASSPPRDYVGRAPVAGTFKSKAQEHEYNADFSDYKVPSSVAGKFSYDASEKQIRFSGKMSLDELNALFVNADEEQKWALKNLHFHADWFQSELSSLVISPIKKLREWAFVLCFLCIGLSTRFRDLATFGLKPFWAFTIGVIVNVPLGYILTTRVFVDFWRGL
ncbi:MAG: putative sulfate exporter family transporter [Deltaproteobacteria bacterium]|nr:putative sulfate exporter family transporter [Deltaproteobacteria bacterium]